MQKKILCAVCRTYHKGWLTDLAFNLPDIVAVASDVERAEAQTVLIPDTTTPDMCVFDDRCYVRCVLRVPFTQQKGAFGFGVWVKIATPNFFVFRDAYRGILSPRDAVVSGLLATKVPPYGDTLNQPVKITIPSNKKLRPTVFLSPEATTRLVLDQHDGINHVRFHEIVDFLVNELGIDVNRIMRRYH